MSTPLGTPVSINPGATITWEVFFTSPGWYGIITWVPQPQEDGTLLLSSPYITLDSDCKVHFGQHVTNPSASTKSFVVQYSIS